MVETDTLDRLSAVLGDLNQRGLTPHLCRLLQTHYVKQFSQALTLMVRVYHEPIHHPDRWLELQ